MQQAEPASAKGQGRFIGRHRRLSRLAKQFSLLEESWFFGGFRCNATQGALGLRRPDKVHKAAVVATRAHTATIDEDISQKKCDFPQDGRESILHISRSQLKPPMHPWDNPTPSRHPPTCIVGVKCSAWGVHWNI